MSAAADTSGGQVITVTIDGREIQARPGQTILEVARAAGIEIPTLCYDPRLEPYGACRMCLVEVEGARGPMAACGTAVQEGMKVYTRSDKIMQLRRFVLELLLTNHPLDCPVCEAAGDCRLQDYAYEYLVDMVPWGWRGPVTGNPGDHPNIAHFPARCILCGRCVRICREVMSIGCWGYLSRGYDSEVDTPYRLPLREVGCVSCGQCVSTCPVGAIVTQRSEDGARAWQTEKISSTCGYCGDGCQIVLHTYRNKVVKVSADLDKEPNRGNLCVKGRFGFGYVSAPDRLKAPLIRSATGDLEETTWEHALEVVRDKLQAAKAARGAKAIAAWVGTHVTNEAAYLLQKMMRAVLGSDNLGSVERENAAAVEEVLRATFGRPGSTGTRENLAQAEAILVVGSNLTESHPVFALEVIKALRTGKTVIVMDPRRTEIAAKASIHLQVRAGGDLAALRVILREILELKARTGSLEIGETGPLAELRAQLAQVDPEAEANAAGVGLNSLIEAADVLGRAGRLAVVLGTGVSSGPDANAITTALCNLVLLDSTAGEAGDVFFLRSGANAQGLADLGVRPNRLPAGKALSDEEARTRCEEVWGVSLAGLSAGLGVGEAIAAAARGELACLMVFGADPVLELAGEGTTRGALEKVDFLVVYDSFLTETAKMADVVLPACVPAETDGSFTNSERVIQSLQAAVVAPGECLADWQAVQRIANALGAAWDYRNADEITDEWQRLLATVDTRQPAAHVSVIPGPPAKALQLDATDGFLLITGSVREHHGTGEWTRRARGTSALASEALLELNPADAQRLGVADGAVVVVSGAQGSVEVRARVTERVPAGIVFLPWFSPDVRTNRLFEPDRANLTRVQIAAKR
ncbi:MAG: molybdopterin-dependent oxidoreductase [Thermoleophilia bacterium]|nr:molybdopterin-dependent oxidoreductase [Thermoleophilia bacterium]